MNLDELLDLAEAATPGPWRSLATGSEGCSVVADAPANRIGFGRVARLTARSLDEDP